MAKVTFKDNTVKCVTAKQLQFILGIKGIKEKIFTYEFV